MKPLKIDPRASYRSQVKKQLEWWVGFRDEAVDLLKEATIYEVVVALQEDHKRATRKIFTLSKDLEACDDVHD